MSRLAVLSGLCALVCMIPAAHPLRAATRDVSRGDPAVAAARASLIAELHRIRPDVTRVDAKVIGHPVIRVPAGGKWVVPRDAMRGHSLAPHLCVWVDIRSAGRTIASIPVWFAVKAYRPVLVSAAHHWARDEIESGDFRTEVRNVAGLGGSPIDVNASLAEMRTRRAIAQGDILMSSDIEPIPDIVPGAQVAVMVKYGAVSIETEGVARREARLGETIELRNPSSHETYTAQVVGRDRAVVEVSQ